MMPQPISRRIEPLLLARVALGGIWAAGLMLAGLLLWWPGRGMLGDFVEPLLADPRQLEQIAPFAAIWCIASGQLIFLALVGDALFPRTPAVVSGLIKAVVMLVWFLSPIAMGWQILGTL